MNDINFERYNFELIENEAVNEIANMTQCKYIIAKQTKEIKMLLDYIKDYLCNKHIIALKVSKYRLGKKYNKLVKDSNRREKTREGEKKRLEGTIEDLNKIIASKNKTIEKYKNWKKWKFDRLKKQIRKKNIPAIKELLG